MKILLYECKMSFKIGSLTCMKYIEKQPTQYQPLPLSIGNNVQTQNLKSGYKKKMNARGYLKSSFHRYFPRGLTVFYVKKGCEIKYGFEDPISNAGLGLFQLPNNQLMFSFVIL